VFRRRADSISDPEEDVAELIPLIARLLAEWQKVRRPRGNEPTRLDYRGVSVHIKGDITRVRAWVPDVAKRS
jgi:hypothetical protein